MKKIFTSLFATFALFVAVVFPIAPVLAEEPCNPEKQLCNPIEADTFSEFVSDVTEVAVTVLLPFVVLSFIYAGFLFVQAQGKPEAIKSAQNSLYYSVIGALVLFGAWGFAQVIETTVGTVTGISETSR